MRITHWIKNLFLFVPLIFSRQLMFTSSLSRVFYGFIAFCLVTSSVYILNDIRDAPRDRLHPVKKNRPIASFEVGIPSASILCLFLLFLGVSLSFSLGWDFLICLILYVIINILYTFFLKKAVILDLICIAAGFVLRVLAGSAAISVFTSRWLLLTTMFLSLFLAVMKRRSELSLQLNGNSRQVLEDYSISFADQLGSISAGGVIICYALYTVSERMLRFAQGENFVYTTVFVVFGIFRYLYLSHIKSRGENPTELMLTDLPMLINMALYVAVSVFIIYF